MKKILKYAGYSILSLIICMLVLMILPKGSLEKQLKANNIPAVGYAVIKDGKVVEAEVLGNLEEGKPANDNTVFNVASVAKPVFTTMVMQLINDHIISLDEPVYHYWIDPDLQSDPRHKKLTPRILLSHQSGFPNWRWYNEDQKLSFWFDPGTTYHYSGEGMEYLKKMVENKTGKSLTQLMDSIIFQPLDMHASSLTWLDELHEKNLAKYHDGDGNVYETFKRENAVASDDLLTTVSDMTKFALFVMNEKSALSDQNYDEMTSIQTRINKRNGYGLGWQIAQDLPNGEFALVHGGADQGARARIVILPKSKTAFIAFTNSDNGQIIVDRLMVKKLKSGGKILDKIYSPFIWRIIYLPFRLF